MRSIACAFTFVLVACSERIPDRHTYPESALLAARAALHNQDLPSYFDALTDDAVRQTLTNSISICRFDHPPDLRAVMQASGYNPSVGCADILRSHNWSISMPPDTADYSRALNEALLRVANPRALAVELERNHRRTGAGTSFVWEWLDGVTLKSISVSGDSASALASWGDGEWNRVEFRRDSTGWRFTPHPEARPDAAP